MLQKWEIRGPAWRCSDCPPAAITSTTPAWAAPRTCESKRDKEDHYIANPWTTKHVQRRHRRGGMVKMETKTKTKTKIETKIEIEIKTKTCWHCTQVRNSTQLLSQSSPKHAYQRAHLLHAASPQPPCSLKAVRNRQWKGRYLFARVNRKTQQHFEDINQERELSPGSCVKAL